MTKPLNSRPRSYVGTSGPQLNPRTVTGALDGVAATHRRTHRNPLGQDTTDLHADGGHASFGHVDWVAWSMVSVATVTEAPVRDPELAPPQGWAPRPSTTPPTVPPWPDDLGLRARPIDLGAPRPTRSDLQRAKRRRSHWIVIPWVLALGTLAVRLLTRASGPTDWDASQYASAVNHFDVAHGQPQPPGYWLYVETGRVLHLLTGMGVIESLVLVAAVASAAAVGLTAVAGRDLGGPWVGVAAGLVVAASPFAWFNGSTVSTYSFDMLTCAVLIVLAWRARPGSWHGIGAVVALGLLAGYRQSDSLAFVILALLAVLGSTRRWSRLGVTVLAGAAAVAVWFVPMVLSQPGGFPTWLHATRTEASGAAEITSVFDHAAGAGTNAGTFAAYTALALAPLAALALLAGVLVLVRRLVIPAHADAGPDPDPPAVDTAFHVGPEWTRPWYQSRTIVLGAAILPPVLMVTLIQFAKGGYLLAYLPAAVIALLLPLGALNRRRRQPGRISPVWVVITSVLVGAVVVVGAERFVSAQAVIPTQWTGNTAALWLDQPRYQAPYPSTFAAIRNADTIDDALGALGRSVGSASDVIVFDTVDGGDTLYRNAGWELPDRRIALVAPGTVLYNEEHGALYYRPPTAITVGPGGSVLLVASPAMPGLAQLTKDQQALPVTTEQLIGGYRVWRIQPGVSVLGVPVRASAGPRPLGHSI